MRSNDAQKQLARTSARTALKGWLTTVFPRLKAMLHEAIFLATCIVTMTNKKPFKLQRGCYTQATCLATLRKVEGCSTFLATRNATMAVAKWGVTRECCKLQEKLLRVTWLLVAHATIACQSSVLIRRASKNDASKPKKKREHI